MCHHLEERTSRLVGEREADRDEEMEPDVEGPDLEEQDAPIASADD